MELNINMKSRNLAKMFCPQSKHIIQRTGSISPGEGRVFTGRYWGSDGGRWWSRRTCAHPPVRAPKLQLAAEQPSTGECWIPPKKDTPKLLETLVGTCNIKIIFIIILILLAFYIVLTYL